MLISAFLAAITLGAPFTDGSVLQRGMKVPVWGDCGPSKIARDVVVEFAGQEKSSAVDPSGRWRVDLDPMEASAESRTMTVTVKTYDSVLFGRLFPAKETVEVKDVLVGEVWFASGQSNMECPIWGSACRYRDFEGGLMTTMTRLPNVRYVKVPRNWSVEPEPISAKWRKFIPEDLQSFCVAKTGSGRTNHNSLSAVAFYYARELYLALGIPVGIVDASWGGVNIDCFIPRCGWDDCAPEIKWLADYKLKKDWKTETDKKDPVSAAHKQPTVLWNAMVDAFTPMAMRGFIWYQGCSNHGEGDIYALKMHALYNGWSRAFQNPDLKLYFVQLAPWEQNWMNIVQAQNKFVSEEKNAAIAVTADVGNFSDIHPNRKEIVAKRLVVHALKRDYGFNIPEDDSPVLRSVAFADGKATLKFDHVKSWYAYDADFWHEPPFELAGKDGVWKDAKLVNEANRQPWQCGEIKGVDLVLVAEGVEEPVRVRYLGKNKTMGNLFNEASLPLGPFETK